MWERVEFEKMTDDEKRIASHPLVPWVLIVVMLGAACGIPLMVLFVGRPTPPHPQTQIVYVNKVLNAVSIDFGPAK